LPGARALSNRGTTHRRNNHAETPQFRMISKNLSQPWQFFHQLNFYLGAASSWASVCRSRVADRVA
jgi:hypothetical protein